MVLDLEVANHAGVLSFYGADKLHVNGFSDDFRLRRLFGSLMEPPVTMMSGF
jgi:hypothetical protein